MINYLYILFLEGKMKRIFSIFLATTLICLIGFVGCNTNQQSLLNGKTAYELYKEKYEYSGTENEWLRDIADGLLGKNHTVNFSFQCDIDDVVKEVVHRGKVEAVVPGEALMADRLGYVFSGWVYDDGEDFRFWDFENDKVLSDITLVAKWDYATKELPIINVNTNGAEINSKIDYTNMTFSIENCEGELSEVTGGIRLRGNSTLNFVKKPYRIKFDKKQSLFGLPKAKSWVLLADYLDPSSLYNYSAMSIGAEMPGLAFTTTPNKVNLYLNGEFMGLYTLCEQVQENEGRMNIEMDEITEDMTQLKDFNFFISLDGKARLDEDAVEGETYFLVDNGKDQWQWWCFELKYPEKEDFCSDAQFRSFFNQLEEYIKYLLIDFGEKNVQSIKQQVNVNSLVDFLIVDQLMGERDHANYSFNMYYSNTSTAEENGKLNFGPIWDYDRCLLIKNSSEPNQTYESYYGKDKVWESANPFYSPFYKTPELLSIVKERYALYGVPALEKYLSRLDDVVLSIKESNELNRQRWYSELDVEIVDKNITFMKEFFSDRKRILDRDWT